MKKRLYFISTLILCATLLSLSSCLKDNRYVDFSKGSPIVEFNLGGLAYLGQDAITDAGDTITKQFAISVASVSPPTTATTVTVAVDNSILTNYVTANPGINYLPMPAGSFVLSSTTATIPAGQRVAIISVTFYKGLLDPSQSYMLPIKIASTSGGYTISGNMAIHYYHFIGNDFAGAYLHDFTRIPPAGNYVGQPATLSPVNPTQFECMGGYFTGTVRYEVTFTKTGTGAAATYSNFAITLNQSDIDNILTPAGIGVASGPTIVGYNPAHQYTYTEATHGLFVFNWHTVSGRNNTDFFYKP